MRRLEGRFIFKNVTSKYVSRIPDDWSAQVVDGQEQVQSSAESFGLEVHNVGIERANSHDASRRQN